MSFMWKAKTSLSRSTSASAAPLSSVLGGFSGRAGGFNPIQRWLLSRRNQRTKALEKGFLLLFVPLVIYSCASHKVNHPLSLTLHAPLSAREKSAAALFIFNHFLCGRNNQWLFWKRRSMIFLFHHNMGKNGDKSTPLLPRRVRIPPLLPRTVIIYCPSAWEILCASLPRPQ